MPFGWAACDNGRGDDVREMGTVALTIATPDVVVNSVHFELSGNGVSRSGEIDVRAPGATVSALVGGIPAGIGYSVALRAAATDGRTTCAGSGRADVFARATTPLAVVLTCQKPNEGGNVMGTATFNICPRLTSLAATPTMMSVGDQEAIDLTAVAQDGEHDPLVFSWSAPVGSFDSPAGVRTRYRCAAPGPVAITITVSDGQCNDTVTATLVCLPFCATKPDGTSCNDESPCTQVDSCQSGRCVGGAPVVCRPLDQCHVPGVCDPTNGTCSNPMAADWTVCDDGDLCTQADRCLIGRCEGNNPVICAAVDQCHGAGTCAPATGICSNLPQPDGLACLLVNATAACRAGTCAISSCDIGTRDCNSLAVDGCETPTTTN
ncbi:MAG: hypothetical protein ABUL67_00830, partial [Haliangium ochraceum]